MEKDKSSTPPPKSSPEKRKLQPADKTKNEMKVMRLHHSDSASHSTYDVVDIDTSPTISLFNTTSSDHSLHNVSELSGDPNLILVDEDYMRIKPEPGLYKKFLTITEENLYKDDDDASTSATESQSTSSEGSSTSTNSSLPVITNAEDYLGNTPSQDFIFSSESRMRACSRFSELMCDKLIKCVYKSVCEAAAKLTAEDWAADRFNNIILFFNNSIFEVFIENAFAIITRAFKHLKDEEYSALVEEVSRNEADQISTQMTESLVTCEFLIPYAITDGFVNALNEQIIPVEGHYRTTNSMFLMEIIEGVVELFKKGYVNTVVSTLPEAIKSKAVDDVSKQMNDGAAGGGAAEGGAELDVIAGGIVPDAIGAGAELDVAALGAEENNENINLADIVEITCPVAHLYNDLLNGRNNGNITFAIQFELIKLVNPQELVAQDLIKPEDVADYERITRYYQNINTPNVEAERYEAHFNYVRNKLIKRLQDNRKKWVKVRKDIAEVYRKLRDTGIFTQEMLNILQFENVPKNLIHY